MDTLILYRDFENEDLFRNIVWLKDHFEDERETKEDRVLVAYKCANLLAELAAEHGFEGCLWDNYLAFLLANQENAYSTACEMTGKVEGSINRLALHDFRILKALFHFDYEEVDRYLGIECFEILKDYRNAERSGKVFNSRIRDRISELALELKRADNEEAFADIVNAFYQSSGVGKLGLHKAFRIQNNSGAVQIRPITSIEHIYMKDLVGYEIQKKKLMDNTEAFINGLSSNNVLLYGDSGTGKSSSIKAILNEYYDRGLRMIEVYKHQFGDLSSVIAQIKDRKYKFIIFMDDLSFEDYEIEYKYLKAIIEGGLEKKPDNVLIYATSNRRHLVREKWSDKEDRREDLHASDTVEEKLSLAARFGVSIFYVAPNKKEYQSIVKVLAEKYHILMEEEELYLEANKWELSHGGLSGRTAQQFINYLIGRVK